MQLKLRLFDVVALGACAFLAQPRSSAITVADIDPACQQSSTAIRTVGTTLEQKTQTRSAVAWNGTEQVLKLVRGAGYIKNTSLGINDTLFMGCSADFDGDGWADFVGSDTDGTGYLKVYKNRTFDNPAPDWNDINAYRTPKFIVPSATVNPTYIVESSSTYKGIGSLVCADFDADGKQDFLIMRCASGTKCDTASRAVIFRGKGNGTFYAPYQFVDNLTKIGKLQKEGTRIAYVDWNGDGKKDLIVGLATANGSGKVNVYYNDGGATPMFSTYATLMDNVGMGTYNGTDSFGVTALAVADFTNDGRLDIVLGGTTTSTLRLYAGIAGGFSPTYTSLPFTGGAVTILAADFTRNGHNDLVVGADGFGGYPGFNSFLYVNDGTAAPFPLSGRQQLTSKGNPASDYDVGFIIDYDHDPDNTPDFVIADGNNSVNYYLFVNRSRGPLYADCGTVQSDALDLGSLAGSEIAVTEVRIAPEPAHTPASDGTITWQASNDGGLTWHPASACADDPDKYCAGFTTSSGSDIRWKATMCSNTGVNAHKYSPKISAVATDFTYVTAELHFRAGPIAKDGLIYIGGFREPAQDGKFYALSEASGNPVWEAGALLDSNASRKIFTRTPSGSKVEFIASNAATIATAIGATSAQATALISWFGGKRFGLATPHVLGGVLTSTPALLSHPGLPYWYTYETTTQAEKALIKGHIESYKNRKELVFFGSKDGAVHAIYTNPSNVADTTNGKEAWAFVPTSVLTHLLTDKTNGTATAYPDGSPTLATVKIDGVLKTVLVMGEGNGGSSVFALDVTDTIGSNGAVVGPTPLWSFTDANMGLTFSKPTVIRVLHDYDEKYLAVFASGQGASSDKGDTVYAVDIATGELVWRFDIGDSNTYIASDITAAETDDEADTLVDGYIDRVFFADNKGRVYKLNPGAYSAAGAIEGLGSIDAGAVKALFSTHHTDGALGEERAIAGTIMAVADSAKRLVLYFGTGGTEDTPATAQNAFYAIYADTGEIKHKLDGESGVAAGVKFYGGMTYNDGQIVFTRGSDLSGLSLCAATAGEMVAIDANSFTEQFVVATDSKIVAPMYASAGVTYTVTLAGNVKVLGSASSPSEGGSGGSGGESGGSGGGNSNDPDDTWGVNEEPFSVISWKQDY